MLFNLNTSPMYNETERLQKKLDGIYRKQPWYGESITAVLKTITMDQAGVKPAGRANSPVGIVSHILAWRVFMQKRLEGDRTFDVDNSESFRWEVYGDTPEQAWKNLLLKLDENQEKLLKLISKLEPGKLDETVSGRSYSFRDMIEGVIQHDIYHLGQINLIIKHFAEINSPDK
jgi:uncharacterized damage-inducible protein DinB